MPKLTEFPLVDWTCHCGQTVKIPSNAVKTKKHCLVCSANASRAAARKSYAERMARK